MLETFKFGDFELDAEQRTLTCRGKPVSLAPKTFDLLILLARSQGRLVTKAEILAALWPETSVEEGNIPFQISSLRRSLGPASAEWIQTVPKYGYRFSPSATPLPTALTNNAKQEPTRTARGVLLERTHWFAFVAITVLAIVLLIGLQGGRQAPSLIPVTRYPGSETSPSFAPNGRDIAFVWIKGDFQRSQIYVKRDGLNEPVRVTSGEQMDISPAWSPDGRWIAFVRFAPPDRIEYFVKPWPEGPERKVGESYNCTNENTRLFRFIAWSPSAGNLIVSRSTGAAEPCSLALLSIETGTVQPLTHPPGPSYRDVDPAVSADGRRLAFVRFTDWPNSYIYSMPLSGSGTARGPETRITSEYGLFERSPSWLPDSQALVFQACPTKDTRCGLFRVSASGGRPQAVPNIAPPVQHPTVARDGTLAYATSSEQWVGLWRVEIPSAANGSAAVSEIAFSERLHQMPAHSPDGRRIVFESERSGNREIWMANVDGSDPRQLTYFGKRAAQGPRWSPDGQEVAFSVNSDGQRDLFVISVEDGKVRQLTSTPADEAGPDWSPDGKYICFTSTQSGDYQIWRIPAHGGAAAQITRSGGTSCRPSPDGRFVYFQKRRLHSASIWRVPPEGGEEVKVLEDVLPRYAYAVTREGLFYVPATSRSFGSYELIFAAFGDQRREPIANLPGMISWGISIAPDRSHVLYSRAKTAEADIVMRPPPW